MAGFVAGSLVGFVAGSLVGFVANRVSVHGAASPRDSRPARHRTAGNCHRIAGNRGPDLERQLALQHTSAFGTVNYNAS
jgi:hypothetical protein